jgi:hypothetical protein
MRTSSVTMLDNSGLLGIISHSNPTTMAALRATIPLPRLQEHTIRLPKKSRMDFMMIPSIMTFQTALQPQLRLTLTNKHERCSPILMEYTVDL